MNYTLIHRKVKSSFIDRLVLKYLVSNNENNTTQIPWVFSRIKNIYQLFFGDVQKREIITNNKVPPGFYTMLYAIHKDNLQDLKA